MDCWNIYPVRKEEEAAWCEWCRLEDKGLLPDPWIIHERIMVMSQEDSNWKDGFAPRFWKWLNGKGWNDEPYQKPAQQNGGPPGGGTRGQAPEYQGMRINSVAQGVTAENDAIAKRLLAERRRQENAGNTVAIGTDQDGVDHHETHVPQLPDDSGYH